MNGFAIPASMAVPRRRAWVAVGVAIAVAAALSLGARGWLGAGSRDDGGLTGTFTLQPMDMEVKVTKDGELQAVDNIDVQSQVEGRNTMVFVVKEGSQVKKGDLLVELDSSVIRQNLLQATLEKQQAESDLKAAKELLSIQESQNEADLAAADVALELAEIALEQYRDGLYPQELKNAKTLVEMSDIMVKNKQEDLQQTKNLFAKGFVTAADVKEAELDVTTVQNDLDKSNTALTVLTGFTSRMEFASRRSAVTQAEQALARVRKTNVSMLSKAQADADTKTLMLTTKAANFEKLQQQLANCKILAPADGMVVYVYDDDDDRIAEGAEARERQRLLRLPDLSKMKAVMKVNESQAARLRVGQRASVRITGIAEPVEATLTKINPVADSGSRWWNPDLKEYPVELVLDYSPPTARPGLSVSAEIFVERLEDTLAVPLAAIYSNRAGSYVFVREGEGQFKPAKVRLGQVNTTHAQVLDGVSTGQKVVLLQVGQGQDLLEKAGIKVDPEPRQKRAPRENLEEPVPAIEVKQEKPADKPGGQDADKERKKKPKGPTTSVARPD